MPRTRHTRRILAAVGAAFCVLVGLIGPAAIPAQAAATPGPELTFQSAPDDNTRIIGLKPPTAWTSQGNEWPAVTQLFLTFSNVTPSDTFSSGGATLDITNDSPTAPDRSWSITLATAFPLDPAESWRAVGYAVFADGSRTDWSVSDFVLWGAGYTGPPDSGGGTPPPPPPNDPLGLSKVVIDRTTPSPQLRWRISFTPVDPSQAVRYRFSWSTTPTGTTPGTVQSCSSTASPCWLNAGTGTDNGTTWNLMARLVTSNGTKGPWTTMSVALPESILVLVLGDSVQAGHHRDAEGSPTLCHDTSYAMGRTVFNELRASAPVAWRDAFVEVNLAESGFGLDEIIKGGTDACGKTHVSPLEVAEVLLRGNRGSWTVVIVDGGINDTNWGSVLTDLLANNGRVKKAADCKPYLSRWTLPEAAIGQNAKQIVGLIRTSDPSARLLWTGYYNVAGTGTAGIVVPLVCKSAIQQALNRLEGVLRPAVESQGGKWVPLNPVLGGRDDLLQDLYPSDLLPGNPFKTIAGLPHPNETGAVLSGKAILKKT